MKEERRKQMGDMIAKHHSVSMEQLRQTFGVSMNTVRSDVAYLINTGAVEKIYGGVRVNDHKPVPLFTSRADLHPQQKLQIARLAETLIQDGDIVFIDAGTTTMHLIDCLDNRKHITIVTANLYVIQKAFAKENVKLVVLPGALNRRTNSASDVSTLEYLSRYQFNKAFMGVSGVSQDGMLNVSTYIEYELKRTALSHSDETYLLVDASKFGGTGLMSYGKLEDMRCVITDSDCPETVKEYCKKHSLPLTLAEG